MRNGDCTWKTFIDTNFWIKWSRLDFFLDTLSNSCALSQRLWIFKFCGVVQTTCFRQWNQNEINTIALKMHACWRCWWDQRILDPFVSICMVDHCRSFFINALMQRENIVPEQSHSAMPKCAWNDLQKFLHSQSWMKKAKCCVLQKGLQPETFYFASVAMPQFSLCWLENKVIDEPQSHCRFFTGDQLAETVSDSSAVQTIMITAVACCSSSMTLFCLKIHAINCLTLFFSVVSWGCNPFSISVTAIPGPTQTCCTQS